LDDEFASKTIFKQKIIHGFLSGSVFSKIFGTIYPGNGTLYLKQSMVFLAPMYTNKDYKATLALIDQIEQKKRAIYKTDIIDPDGKLVFTGEAVIVHDIFA
jgi:acyl dehydratase